MGMATAFGTAALALALIGIYGVVAYNVAQRRPELGLRLALGATRGELLTMVLRGGFRPVLFGLGSGLLLYFTISRFIRSLLFGVTPLDPFTISVASLTLLAAALLACLLPASSAVRVDPISVLRYE
jgi:ABC-type antimicrobial peptide transport system permease subunit